MSAPGPGGPPQWGRGSGGFDGGHPSAQASFGPLQGMYPPFQYMPYGAPPYGPMMAPGGSQGQAMLAQPFPGPPPGSIYIAPPGVPLQSAAAPSSEEPGQRNEGGGVAQRGRVARAGQRGGGLDGTASAGPSARPSAAAAAAASAAARRARDASGSAATAAAAAPQGASGSVAAASASHPMYGVHKVVNIYFLYTYCYYIYSYYKVAGSLMDFN